MGVETTGCLYLVPTPIGNLGDISHRALETLEQVDFIAAEDTRVSVKLLNHFDIKKRMISYHRHNAEEVGEQILARLLAGERCALVTDAGTPAVSDPGEELVALCAAQRVPVISIPGACAAVTALAASGLPTGRFCFEGFLAMNKKNRREHLAQLEYEQRTMIFYEAPHKLKATLADFAACFGGERRIVLCRELTKLHEEILRMSLAEACDYYETVAPKGEFVLLIAGSEQAAPQRVPTLADGIAEVRKLQAQGMRSKDAVKQSAKALGLARNALYQALLDEEQGEA